MSFRCVICMLFYNDKTIHASRNQAASHIYYDHDYHDKLRTGRIVGIIKEHEKRSAWWLSENLAELSFKQE
ncbi:hypothetical protein [Nitrosopumilus piranensis]|nr:hypothetical protein [Nitrosopumilus piranensis]